MLISLLALNLMQPEFDMPYGPKTAIQPLSITQVKLTDDFWRPRMETNRNVTIWHEIEECEKTGRIANFDAAVGKGKHDGSYIFNDSDVYKVIEAAAYILANGRDSKLESKMDEWIDKIAAAQEPDGYLCTTVTTSKLAGQPKERWDRSMHEHELYNVGHMYEGAVAYGRATGKRKLLDVSVKSADLVCSVFNEKGLKQGPGHQEIEIGLVRLYEATGNKKYLDQAKWFLDTRGNRGKDNWGDYNQDHVPVLEQDKAVGHSVRAAYMYAGMVDVGTHVGDKRYTLASQKLWRDVVKSKTYLTGGIGSSGSNEGFAGEYNLPNLNGYAETCATIANVFWNQRLFMATGDATYVDVLERGLYNAFLSGYGLDGKTFFYPNPLQSVGGASRPRWFGCACCPPNVARLIATLPQYLYATDKDGLWVNLYASNEATFEQRGTKVRLKQHSEMPWGGSTSLAFDLDKPATFTVRLRVPGWSKGVLFPSDLYTGPRDHGAFEVRLQKGGPLPLEERDGYLWIEREWSKGDVLEISLDMEPHWIFSHEKVSDNQGRVALQRGPIVYCAEFADQSDKSVLDNIVQPGAPVKTARKAELGGYIELSVPSKVAARAGGKLALGDAVELKLIPYYAWAHRGPGQMAVWLAAKPEVAWPAPAKTIVFTSKITHSGGQRIEALRDQLEPKTSNDHGVPFFHWWPKKGSTEWVEFAFDGSKEISKAKIYWFEDEGIGECRLPKAYRLLYKDGGAWKPIQAELLVAKDKFCEVSFPSVTTTGLRLEVDLLPRWSTGIHEVIVE